jgi:heptosyltransferase-3
MRILFIKLRHIGDSLLLTPTIVATKQKYPHAEIWVLVRESCDGILAGCPEIDRILTTANPDTAKRTKLGWLSDLKLAALLRRTHFNFVFELTDNDRGRSLALAARTPMRCTNEHHRLKKIWRPIFHKIAKSDRGMMHRVEKDYTCPREILDLPFEPGPLRFDGFKTLPWKPEIYSSANFAVIHPFTRWPSKAWPIENWETLIPDLLKLFPRIIISCGPDRAEVASAIALESKFDSRVDCTRGSATWNHLAWLLDKAGIYVGVDTAAMHLAAACGCPTVALFGPTPISEYHPWKTTHCLVTPENTLINKTCSIINQKQLNLIKPFIVYQSCLKLHNKNSR